MSEDPVINISEFAKSGGHLPGTVPAVKLTRLSDLLCWDSGKVAYGISGRLDWDGNPQLTL